MSNVRDHHLNMVKMKAEMAMSYAESHYGTYSHRYSSQLRVEVVLLRGLLRENTPSDLEHQIDNIVDQCIYASAEVFNGTA